MSEVMQCAWCGAKTRPECRGGIECPQHVHEPGWGCMDHIHPTAEAVRNVACEALKTDNQRIYPVAYRFSRPQHKVVLEEYNSPECYFRDPENWKCEPLYTQHIPVSVVLPQRHDQGDNGIDCFYCDEIEEMLEAAGIKIKES